ncbi:MAG TPA: TonB-dependent receptor [Pseudomonadales bacterium]
MASWTRILAGSAVAALAVPCIAPAVHAQAQVIEEVLVTARKRDEALVDIPVSARAFTEAEIESAGIETPQDFIDLTPNVTLVQTQNAGNAFINIRGVSQARNSEMSAAVLVDGVLMANPAQFNQQLFDIEQIEVLRGPQGALYGRNAIGGAITIVTKQPTDELEGRVQLEGDSGPGISARGAISGPVGRSETLKFRASVSYTDTDGFIKNEFLDEEADPYEDLSGRLKLLWQPNDRFSADLRLSASALDTQALYFVIDAEADDTDLPVRVNNRGTNERDMYTVSLKLDYATDFGTFTSITAYDDLEELLTGDNFNFVPPQESLINFFPIGITIAQLTGDGFADLSQSQYLETDSWSQEIRFISPAEERFRWIAGAYVISTDRFISTGNQVDRGNGVFDVKKEPRVSVFVDPTDPSPQLSLLVDAQDNLAWAVFGEVAYDVTERLELALSLRYDEDERENTTLTEPDYDPTGLNLVPGTVRKETWDAWQPKLTVTWQPQESTTVYGGYSRGFRSGGFNQTGVGGAVPEPGVDDEFDRQIADTFEVGIKSSLWQGRASVSFAAYYTDFEGAYFFFFDPGTSTQNLGSIDEVTYTGFELEGSAVLTDHLSATLGIGYTDSEIEKAADPADEGNQAPLVSEYTLNVGLLYERPLNVLGGVSAIARVDYQRVGDTWWEPSNITKRSPIDLVDARVGIAMPDDWSVTLWIRNAFDEEYNAEFSPGPAPGLNFLWPALPQRWGLELSKRF